MDTMPESETSARRASAKERRLAAFELRKKGKSYREIGKELGATAQSAHRHVTKTLKEIAEKTSDEAERVKVIELARLDELLAMAWEKAEAGDRLAIDTALNVMRRRSALLGLDAPKQTELGGIGGGPVGIDATSIDLSKLTTEELAQFYQLRQKMQNADPDPSGD